MGKWINYIYSYNGILLINKKNELLIHASLWWFSNTCWEKGTRLKRLHYCVVLYRILGKMNLISSDSGSVVTWDQGQGWGLTGKEHKEIFGFHILTVGVLSRACAFIKIQQALCLKCVHLIQCIWHLTDFWNFLAPCLTYNKYSINVTSLSSLVGAQGKQHCVGPVLGLAVVWVGQ